MSSYLRRLASSAFETPELVALPEVGLLADAQLARDLGGIGALGEQPVSLGQLPDHLLRSVPLPLRRHGVSLPARSRGLQGLSQPMDRLTGVTPSRLQDVSHHGPNDTGR